MFAGFLFLLYFIVALRAKVHALPLMTINVFEMPMLLNEMRMLFFLMGMLCKQKM